MGSVTTMTAKISGRIRCEMHFRVSGVTINGMSASKVTVVDYDQATKVAVNLRGRHTGIITVTYKLRGYENNDWEQCPDWLIKLIVEARAQLPWLTPQDA